MTNNIPGNFVRSGLEGKNVLDRSRTESAMYRRTVFGVVIAAILALLIGLEVDHDTLLVEKDVVLPVSRAKAFIFLSDMKNMRLWFPGVNDFEATDVMPMGVGKHFTESYDFPFYGAMESDCVLMGYESPRYISYVCDTWLSRRVEMVLERTDKTPKHPTILTWRMYTRRRSYLFNYGLSPVIGYLYGYTARQALFSLRYALQEESQ